MRTPSPKRQLILDFITSFIQQKGYAPSLREVTAGCDISSISVTSYNLAILEREGRLRRSRDVSRSIGLAHKGEDVPAVPLLGVIAAGDPIPAPAVGFRSSPLGENIAVPRELTRDLDGVYALKVKGSSMIDAMVDDGDIVLMVEASAAEDGEMVAVWLKQEQAATLKRIYYEPGRIRLQPANRQMQPLYTEPDNVVIQGRVVAVIRKIDAPGDG